MLGLHVWAVRQIELQLGTTSTIGSMPWGIADCFVADVAWRVWEPSSLFIWVIAAGSTVPMKFAPGQLRFLVVRWCSGLRCSLWHVRKSLLLVTIRDGLPRTAGNCCLAGVLYHQRTLLDRSPARHLGIPLLASVVPSLSHVLLLTCFVKRFGRPDRTWLLPAASSSSRLVSHSAGQADHFARRAWRSFGSRFEKRDRLRSWRSAVF